MKGITLRVLLIAVVMVPAGCDDDRDRRASRPEAVDTFMVPLPGATFSLEVAHFPRRVFQDGRWNAHTGFDFVDGYAGRPLAEHEPVVAVAAGTVVEIRTRRAMDAHGVSKAVVPGDRGSHAWQVWLEHAGGAWSRYGNLDSTTEELERGSVVERGQIIGFAARFRPAAWTRETDAGRTALHFEFGVSNESRNLVPSESAIEAHEAVAMLFGMDALPRYARMRLRLHQAGRPLDAPYPPENAERDSFRLELPSEMRSGYAHAIPVRWSGDSFRAEEFQARLAGRPQAFLPASNGAWLLACLPAGLGQDSVELTVGSSDRFGRSLFGTRAIPVIRSAERTPILAHGGEEACVHEDVALEKRLLESLGDASRRGTKPIWRMPFVRPLDGELVGPVDEPAISAIRHGCAGPRGINMSVDNRRVVKASNRGVVVTARELPVRGRTVVLDHGAGVLTAYSRLQQITVSVGDTVRRGMAVGLAGAGKDGGRGTLGWELHCSGVPVDPTQWIGKFVPGPAG